MINYVIFLFKHEEEDLSSKRKYFLTVNLMFWNWYYTRKNNTLFGGLHQVTDPISNAFSDVSRFRWKTDNVKTRISSLVFKNGNDQSKPKWNVESRLDGKKTGEMIQQPMRTGCCKWQEVKSKDRWLGKFMWTYIS